MNSLCVIIVAAGSSSRFSSSTPKQFLFLQDIAIRFLGVTRVQKVICVLPEKYIKNYQSTDKVVFVQGGATRQKSVKNGIAAAAVFNPSHVLIHDAVRPYCSTDLIDRVIDMLEKGNLSAIPVVRPVDSVRVAGAVVDRESVFMVQTPQGFDFRTISNLHQKYDGADMSDDASLFDLENMALSFVEGDPKNKKITYKSDIANDFFRIGFGFDSHNFSKNLNRKLKLCGVEIPDMPGLDGVSDADVAIHSLIDAILGATGRGSIGVLFPNDAQTSQNANSMTFLQKILDDTFSIVNIDITIVCNEPNIAKYSSQMIASISGCVNIDMSRVNIKGKTTEGTSITGIAAFSNVLINMS